MSELDIEALRPVDTPAYMTPLWIGCISFAAGDPRFVEQFRIDTGISWTPARSPLDRMIDEACGSDVKIMKAFIEWVNVNVWGPIDGPASCQQPQSGSLPKTRKPR